MSKNELTPEHLRALKDFREQVHGLFEREGDALFEMLDAVVQTPHPSSLAELSLAEACTRSWSSVYQALNRGSIKEAELQALCLQQIPTGREHYHFALDVMAIRRMRSPTLKDRVYCHGAQREVGGKGIIIGLPYSIVAFIDKRGTSWAPSIHTRRVKPQESAVDVALSQTKWLAQRLPADATGEVALDGGYGNLKFFQGLGGVKVFATARIRNDRVFYQIPSPTNAEEEKPKPGRPTKYGAAFHCNHPASWPAPDQILEFQDPSYGDVRLELWSALRLRVKDQCLDLAVVRSQIHLKKDTPPAAHWYAVHNGTTQKTTLERVFECITHRWPIEPANRFRKHRLHADLPKVRSPLASDLWLQLLQIIEWQLYLWLPAAHDVHLPWQPPLPLSQLTPGRVIRSLSQHLPQVGTPVRSLLPRGKPPGWKTGRPRTPPKTYPLVPKKPKKTPRLSKNE